MHLQFIRNGNSFHRLVYTSAIYIYACLCPYMYLGVSTTRTFSLVAVLVHFHSYLCRTHSAV